MQVRFESASSCEVYQHSSDVSANQGRYRDLKLHPEEAVELPEAMEWPALGEFIRTINRCDAFRTSGCMASGDTLGGHAAPYVDIFLDHPWTRVSNDARKKLVRELLELNDPSILPDFILELRDSSARLPDGEWIRSLRLWFIGKRTDAEEAFPLVIDKLRAQNVADYIPIAEWDYKVQKQAPIRFALTTGGWVVAVVMAAWFASRYGWMFGIGGAIAGFMLYPVALFTFFMVRLQFRNRGKLSEAIRDGI